MADKAGNAAAHGNDKRGTRVASIMTLTLVLMLNSILTQ